MPQPIINAQQALPNNSANVVPLLPAEKQYNIPLKYRKMENLHIVFWLFKDISWCMFWRPLGIAMIFPTLIISIIIAYRTRQYMSELCHNLAITVWISANSYWMISEFLHFDDRLAFPGVTFKHLAMIPFTIGVLILAYYYLYWKPTHKNALDSM
ncbi:hypothetical protein [Hydrotalea sandarakina]|uniref:Uncharacterized protein n=1 Tax=Hydrotalea sandarakina TaxID=1004304 RepID=A0A2W7RW80_9BACT|nr:hypothetical protein [Hydrotalea sandarakina]PZX64731.1 hypothetical protein LX80_00932 [Hydrotalea sandarakina]